MPERFSHSNYIDIVRRLVPTLGHDQSTVVKSDQVPNLEKIVVWWQSKGKYFNI